MIDTMNNGARRFDGLDQLRMVDSAFNCHIGADGFNVDFCHADVHGFHTLDLLNRFREVDKTRAADGLVYVENDSSEIHSSSFLIFRDLFFLFMIQMYLDQTAGGGPTTLPEARGKGN
jgi:hypothetical protein